MSLTRELLSELSLPEDAIDRILQAHQAETTRIQGEYDAYRRQAEAQRTAGERQSVIRAALRRAGANEQAVPLLAMAVTTGDADWDGASLRDEAGVLAPVQQQYAAFFSQPVPLPTDPVSPPLESGSMTLEDVRGMSPAQINDNWSLICAALAQRS